MDAARYLTAVVLAALATAGCSTAPDAEPQQTDAATDQPEQVAPVDYSEETMQFVENYASQLDWMVGPFDDTELNEIGAAKVQKVTERHDQSYYLDVDPPELPMTIGEMLQLPGAVAYHFVGRGEPLADVELVLVPYPDGGGGHDEAFADIELPGFIMTFDRHYPTSNTPIPTGDADLDRWDELDADTLGALLDEGELFVIYQHMTGCGNSPLLNKQLAGLELPDDTPLYVDHDFEALTAHIDDDRLKLPSSAFLAFDGGQWVDMYPGMLPPVEETFGHFFQRVGLTDDGPTAPVVDAEAFEEDADLALALTWSNHWTSLDMDREDLRGIRIRHGAISGSTFRDADLSGAHIENTIIASTDFEGADLSGAVVDNVTVRDVVCVDGTTRSGDAEDCLQP